MRKVQILFPEPLLKRLRIPVFDGGRRISASWLLEQVAGEPGAWILTDQVLFEYYRLVRNPVVLSRPLSAAEAARRHGPSTPFWRSPSGATG